MKKTLMIAIVLIAFPFGLWSQSTGISGVGVNATALQNTPVSGTKPTTSQCFVFDGTKWGPGSCSTGTGTVTASGSPVAGNISKFTTGTNIAPASVTDIINLFSSCSSGQVLGQSGFCVSILSNPLTTKGDIIDSADNSGTPQRLAIGGANTFLGVSGGLPAWTALTLAGAQFANQGTTTTLLHGNAAGNPSWLGISLTNDAVANQGTATTVLHGNGAGQPSWLGISLTNDVLANQGTTTTVYHGNGAGQPSFGSVVGGDFGTSIAASSWFGNATGSPAAPAFNTSAIPAGMLPSTTVYGGQSNTYSTGTQDFSSAAHLYVPVGAGATAGHASELIFDSTAKTLHTYINAADTILAGYPTGSAPTASQCATWVAAGSAFTLGSTACSAGTINAASQYAPTYYSGAGSSSSISGVSPPTTNGIYSMIWNVTGGAAVAPTIALGGIPVDATNPATLLYSDRANYLNWTSGTALALPAVTSNFASNFPFVIKNTSTTLTITPNAAASDLIDGAASGTVIPNFAAFVYQDSTTAPGHWFTIKVPTFAAFSSCTDTGGNHVNFSTTAGFSCGTSVPSTTVTSAASLTSTYLVSGAGSQGIQTPSSAATLDSSGNIKGNTLSGTALTNQFVAGTGSNLTTLNFPAPSGGVTLTFPNTAEYMVGVNSDTTVTHVAHSTAVAGVLNMAAISTSDLPTIPIAGGGTNATSAAAGTIPNATSTTASSWTATPTLGVNTSVNGTLGLANGGASGTTTTLEATQTTTGGVIFNLPATNGTNGYILKTDGSGNTAWIVAPGGGNVSNSGSPAQYQTSVWVDSTHVTGVSPSATAGIPLVSDGSSAYPIYTTAVIAGGGTGATSFNAYGVILGGTTTTGALQSTAAAAAGTVLTGTGVTSNPAFSATPALGTDNSVAGSVQTASSGSNYHNIWGSSASMTGTNTIDGFTVVPTANHMVYCAVVSTTCTLTDAGFTYSSVLTGSPTQYGVALGGAAQALGFTAAGASNMPLIGQGASANPVFSTVGHPSSCTQGGLVYGSTSTQMSCGSLLTQYGVVVAGASGSSPVSTSAGAAGTLLTGQGSSNPTFSATPTLGVAGSTLGSIALCPATGSNCITIKPTNSTGASVNFAFPTSNGTNTYVLQTDGSGNTSWTAAGTGNLTATTPTAHGVMLGEGTQALSVTAAGTTGQCFEGSTGADPGWATCPSGTISGLTTNGVVYAASSTTVASTAAGTAKQIVLAGSPPTLSDFPEHLIIPAANCNNATAGAGWSVASTFTATCRAGSNNLNGVLNGVPSTGATAYFDIELPADWDTSVKPYINIAYGSGANTSGTVIWTVSTACTKADGSVTDDPSWIAESAMGSQTMAAANRMWGQNAQIAGAMTNCVAGGTMYFKLALSGSATSAIQASKAMVTIPRLITVQAE